MASELLLMGSNYQVDGPVGPVVRVTHEAPSCALPRDTARS